MYNLNSVHIILQEGFKTLIYSRIWVALCVLGYTQASLVLFGGGVNIRTYSIMLMLGGYVLYVLPFFYYSIVSKKPPRNARQQWVHDHLRRFYITAGVGIQVSGGCG